MGIVGSVLDAGYRRAARPVLFRLGSGDPEVAHRRAVGALGAVSRHPLLCRTMGRLLATDPAPRTVFGVEFRNAVGLAAGVDKDGHALAAWPALGFGFVEAGTVTSHPQQGSDTPRLFRLPASEAIVNRMGFNNDGAADLADRVTAIGGRGSIGVPLGISLGKSKVTPLGEAIGDYLNSLTAVHAVADYIAVNVSSPNTHGLRSLQDRGPLDELIGALTEQANLLAGNGSGRDRAVPVLVKIAPDLTDSAIGDVLEVCTDRGVAGIIATNTTLSRTDIAPADAALAREAGGLSGAPLRRRALEVVRFVCGHTDLPVIGVGGISTPDDGLAVLDAGASLLQLYSGFVYRGPALVRALNTSIAAREPGRQKEK